MMRDGPGLAGGGVVHWVERPGVRLRAAYWPASAPAQGTVLLLTGWKDYLEKYSEPVAALRARGYAVWSLDWRGQGASDRLLPDRLRSHVEGFELFLGDLDRVLDGLVLPQLAGPLVLMGISMGGHLAVRLLARRPEVVDRAVLLAPMMGIVRGGAVVRGLARGLVEAANAVPGMAARYGVGTPRAPMLGGRFEGNRRTGCAVRYAADDALLRSLPEMQLGGVTWGWLRAALRSIAVTRRPGFAEGIGRPVLVLLGEHERVVDNRAARAFAARLPAGRLIEVAAARHELLRERDAVQREVWAAIDAFLVEGGAEGGGETPYIRSVPAPAPTAAG